MMRIPASLARKRLEPSREQISVVKTFPPPVGGLNARDALASMKPTDAVTLENWFPRTTDVVIRGGCTDHVTGFGAKPKSLMLYTPPTGLNKMFASTAANVYDVTSSGALGASVAACTNGYWNWFQMGVSGGHYLLMFNGADKPLYFDGTTWISVDGASTPAITGVTTTGLVSGAIFKRRLFLVEKNKLSFWYLPIDSVGGAAAEFRLGPICTKGGYLMAIGTWTVDGGSGPDDFCVFVTSEGEVVVFQGTDPAVAADWKLVGVYQLGAKPIGRKCLIKYEGDLVLITEFGAIPLARTLKNLSSQRALALTNKIEREFTNAAASYKAIEGWEPAVYPTQNALLFNVPTSTTTSEQYVMNTITKSWSKFSGWNASAFAVLNGELYFADQTKIAKAWVGKSDYGTNIVAKAQCAYIKFGDQAADFKMFRPMFLVDGNIAFSVGLAVDFGTPEQLNAASYTVSAGARWDTDNWDAANWAAGLEIKSEWQGPAAKIGYWAGGIIRIDTNQVEVQWAANDYLFERVGVVG